MVEALILELRVRYRFLLLLLLLELLSYYSFSFFVVVYWNVVCFSSHMSVISDVSTNAFL